MLGFFAAFLALFALGNCSFVGLDCGSFLGFVGLGFGYFLAFMGVFLRVFLHLGFDGVLLGGGRRSGVRARASTRGP